jgi:hypothetical protein
MECRGFVKEGKVNWKPCHEKIPAKVSVLTSPFRKFDLDKFKSTGTDAGIFDSYSQLLKRLGQVEDEVMIKFLSSNFDWEEELEFSDPSKNQPRANGESWAVQNRPSQPRETGVAPRMTNWAKSELGAGNMADGDLRGIIKALTKGDAGCARA